MEEAREIDNERGLMSMQDTGNRVRLSLEIVRATCRLPRSGWSAC